MEMMQVYLIGGSKRSAAERPQQSVMYFCLHWLAAFESQRLGITLNIHHA